MKNKTLIYILAVLSVVFLGSGFYGYWLNNNKQSNAPVEEKKEKKKIVLEYYLEEIQTENMPSNGSDENDEKYLFNRFVCDDGITGNFDTENWKFNILSGNDGICKLYFVKEKYNITITPINAINDENNVYLVKREDTGSFKIIPNEGYKYKESSCSNNKTGNWDSSTNIFSLNSVMNDITCKVTFDKKDFKIDIVVKNGKGNTTEKVYYGDTKSVIVEPNSGFDNPTIKCTNDQISYYENNSLSFEKVTNDTKCTVTFNKIPVEKFSLTINNPVEFDFISITEGNDNIQNIEAGTTTKITLKSNNEENIPNLNCNDDKGNKIIPNITDENELKTIRKFEFLEVKSNITCKITIN